MLESRFASEIADRYALGAGAVLSGPVARGQQGQVWKLDSVRGAFAVKELFVLQTEAGAAADAVPAGAATAASNARTTRPTPRTARMPPKAARGAANSSTTNSLGVGTTS